MDGVELIKIKPVEDSKSEFLSCATARPLHLVEHIALHLSDGDVTPASCVRNLGAYFNESMDISTHVICRRDSRFINFDGFEQVDVRLQYGGIRDITEIFPRWRRVEKSH